MLKNLKSLFIVDDSGEEEKTTPVDAEKTPEVKPTDQKTPDINQSSNSTPPPLPTTRITSVDGTIDAKIVEKLLQAIEKNNLEGFDYLEYKKSLKALEKMPMDEATKYRSAFATAATMGVTLEKLLETTNFYIGVLDKENEQFTGAFKSQFDDKVSGREREIAQFESVIKEKSEQIKKMTEEITKHQEQISVLRTKLEESNNKINKTQNDFKLSYTHLKSQLEADKINMEKYLK